ncbi:MAG: transcriptional regulator NrdR [Waddliaceae bacterium]|nr:transcriptional regulator NrdR [Waddliaceae bacterium]
MKCPYCKHDELKVTDSRNSSECNGIKRRRECLRCQRRFTTFETVDLSMQVHKRDGHYEDFQQSKLIKGLDAACRHTSISRDQILALASRVTQELMQRQAQVLSATAIGEIVMRHLKELDTIAYIRFACVYRRFKDVDELMEAIQKVRVQEEPLEEDSPQVLH